jgi:hypothetical protein
MLAGRELTGGEKTMSRLLSVVIIAAQQKKEFPVNSAGSTPFLQ